MWENVVVGVGAVGDHVAVGVVGKGLIKEQEDREAQSLIKIHFISPKMLVYETK